MVVHFVDIGGIVEHPFVNFLIIVIKIRNITPLHKINHTESKKL